MHSFRYQKSVPFNYTCHRCGKKGHHVKSCPTIGVCVAFYMSSMIFCFPGLNTKLRNRMKYPKLKGYLRKKKNEHENITEKSSSIFILNIIYLNYSINFKSCSLMMGISIWVWVNETWLANRYSREDYFSEKVCVPARSGSWI